VSEVGFADAEVHHVMTGAAKPFGFGRHLHRG
jgi:hypothetical protein